MGQRKIIIIQDGDKIDLDIQGDGASLALVLASAMQGSIQLNSVVISALIVWACRNKCFESLVEQMKHGVDTYPGDIDKVHELNQ